MEPKGNSIKLSMFLKYGLTKVKKAKCQIRKQSIVFLGQIISSEGIKFDPAKTEAITKMPLPRSINELQRFLGVVNYLGKFVPNLPEHNTPLPNLLKKDVAFKVQKPQWDTIENLKTLVTSAPCLKIFNSKLPTCLKTDASSVGLGAFSEQNYGMITNKKWHPIGYSSGALRDNKKCHAQIEKETLSIVFGVECFHELLYGRRFIVINDQKPLKSIFNKSIISSPPCIQKFFLCLQKYNFELQYSPAKDMLISDTLSRSHLSCFEPEFTEDSLAHHVHFVLSNLPISETHLKKFQFETKTDSILQTQITYATHEWPEKHLIPTNLLTYYTHCLDITFCEGILLKNEWIIVPTNIQAEMKSLIHQGHLGIENCKKRTRQSLFWSLMNSEIQDMIKKLPTCLTFWNCQPSEPIINLPITNQAWKKVNADSFCLYGHYCLPISDYYSKFIVTELLNNLQSSTVINKCKKISSQFGPQQS